MGLRASTEEGSPDEVRGCYIAGLFDKFPGEVTELPNIPDWTNVRIKLDGETFSLCQGEKSCPISGSLIYGMVSL